LAVLVDSRIFRTTRASARYRFRGGWRSFVAYVALVALAWPSLGSLPWVATAESHHHGVTQQGAAVDADANDRYYGFDVPGSPTHPADHDCVPCQVLKHLSRCVLSQPPAPDLALPTGCAVQPIARVEPQRARHVAFLPPVRAPPPRAT
jgi:hypothetical protein